MLTSPLSHVRIVCRLNRQTDPVFVAKVRHAEPKKRMARVWEHCKGKMVCELDDVKEEESDPVEGQKKARPGCGHVQPQIRKEGLKLFLVYKRIKDDDDVVRIPFHRAPSRAHLCFRTSKISSLTSVCSLHRTRTMF